MPSGYPSKKTYLDKFYCPKCGKLNLQERNVSSKGKVVHSDCRHCNRPVKVEAGRVDLRA